MTGIIRRMFVVLMSASILAVADGGKQVSINPGTGVRTLALRALRSLKVSLDALEKSNFERSQTFGGHFDAARQLYNCAAEALDGNPADYELAQSSLDKAQAELKWIADNEKLRGEFLKARRALGDKVQDVCEQLQVAMDDDTLKAVAAKVKAAGAAFDKGEMAVALKLLADGSGILAKRIAADVEAIVADAKAAIENGKLSEAGQALGRAQVLAPDNAEVRQLVQDVRSQTVTTLKLTAAMDGKPVQAVVHVDGEWDKLPYVADVKKGSKVSVTMSYASGMAAYGVASAEIVCDWVGEKEIAVELKPVQGPMFRKSWAIALGDGGMELNFVRPGTFKMGRKYGEQSGEMLHDVELRNGYWLGKAEVTQKQWMAIMGANPSFDKSSGDNPVENVSWDDAMLFCRKLTQREKLAGRLPEGYVYTLPTEAQWEYACRAGNDGAYAFGDDELVLALYGNVVGTEDGFAGVAPVCSRRRNAWGFYDMHGNVSEWCRDLYGTYPETRMIDPCGPEEAEPLRIHRGGDWNHSAASARSCTRDFATPSFHDECLGFRVALAKEQ